MTNSGDAAEQIVRMSLEGVEVAAKITGAAAKEVATFLVAALRNKDSTLKTKGKARLASMLKSGKALEIFSVKDSDLQKFYQGAKQYGIVYAVLRDKKGDRDGMCDIMVKADDAPKINRVIERFKFATVDKAKIESEIVKSKSEKAQDAQPAAPDKDDTEKLLDDILGAPEGEQNFSMVMEMLRAGEVREDDDGYQSPLDELYDRLEMRSPEHIAVKYYRDYRSGSGKTLKSIQITLAARLEKFNLESLAAMTVTDEMDLGSLGEKKTALFVIIPDNDTSFNFLVAILYTQLFQALFYQADHKYGGSLPVHVHFIMDEFAKATQFYG